MLRQVSAELFKQEKIESKTQGSDIPEKTERQTREPRTLDKDWSRVNDLRRKLIPNVKNTSRKNYKARDEDRLGASSKYKKVLLVHSPRAGHSCPLRT